MYALFLVQLQKNCSSPTTLFNFCRKHKPQMGLRGEGRGGKQCSTQTCTRVVSPGSAERLLVH